LYQQARANGWITNEDFTNWNLVYPIMRTPDLSTKEIYELVQEAYMDFYFRIREKLFRSFFVRAFWRFLKNPRYWWFFKMTRKFVLEGIKMAPKFADQFEHNGHLEDHLQTAAKSVQKIVNN
jgi:hypothetical protein